MIIDTHCHIHEDEYQQPDAAITRAIDAGVTGMICVGTSEISSEQAIDFALPRGGVFAAFGVHPHESHEGWQKVAELLAAYPDQVNKKIVAIGEVGLDYFYTHSPKEVQIEALRAQLQLAIDYDLPVIFHVREAFDDFWPIFDSFPGIRGVLHSFTDTKATLDEALERGLYIGVNGISTFTKDPVQQAMYDSIPLDRMLLETDAPFLTPVPFRGTINESAFVAHVAEFHAKRRNITLDEIATATTAGANALFAGLQHQ